MTWMPFYLIPVSILALVIVFLWIAELVHRPRP